MIKTLVLTLGSVGCLCCCSYAQNLAPNPSFEEGISQPNFWELKYGPGKWEASGVTGGRSVSVTGTGDCGAMWVSTTNLSFDPGGLYVMRYAGKVTSWGGTGVSEIEGVGSRRALLSDGWGRYSFAAVMPTNQINCRLRLGQCGVNGTMYFDDVEVRSALPVYVQAGNHPLGKGESFSTNLYTCEMRMAELHSNQSRALYQHTAAFRGDEWLGKWYWILTGSDSVTYRHNLDGLSFTNAKVSLTVAYTYGGSLVSEVSTNGDDWQELSSVTPSTGVPVEVNIPDTLLPATELFVRLRTTGTMYLDGYRFEGRVPTDLPSAVGDTWFFETDLASEIARPLSMVNSSTGFVLTVSLTNTNATSRQFEILAQTKGPEVTLERQLKVLVSAHSASQVEIPLSSGGAGENTARLGVRDLELDADVLNGSLEMRVSPIQDDSFGSQLAGTQGCAAWWCDSTHKIGRERSMPIATNQTVLVSAARNEYEPVQIVLRPQTILTNVTVSLTDFANLMVPGAMISSTNVEICLVDYVQITQPTDVTCTTGSYPDPLIPIRSPVSLAAGVNQPFWLTVYVPKNVPAGTYTATLTFHFTADVINVPISLRVFNFTLPDTTHTRTVYGWDYSYGWHRATNAVDYNKIIDLYLQNFARHRITPNFLYNYAPIRITTNWVNNQYVYTHDFNTFDAGMTRFMEEYHFTTLTPTRVPWWGKTYPGYSDWGWGEYAKVMRPIADHLREKGWMDRAFLYAFDEPQQTAAAIASVQDGTRHLEEAVPGLRRLVTTKFQPDYYTFVDIWAPYLRYFDTALARDRKKEGDEAWWYVSTGPRSPWPNNFIDYPAIDHRIRNWLAQRYEVTGDLYWQTAWWTTKGNLLRNPWTDPMSVDPSAGSPWGNGDGMLLYPPVRTVPTSTVVDGPINSLRFDLLREAMEDGEYFWLIDQALQRAEFELGPQHPRVLAAQAARAEALALASSRTTFTRSAKELYKARTGLAEAIELLQDGAPVIITQPISKAVATNSTVALRVEAVGWPSPEYQWFFDGSAIPDATNSLHTIEHAGPLQAGEYCVVVSNSMGVVTSAIARVKGYWSALPAIVQQPTGLVRSAGEKAIFAVAAASKDPISYLWLHNGSPLASIGATNSALLLTNLTANQAGNYSVVLSNVSGAVTSSIARLTLLIPPMSLGLVSTSTTWRYHDLGSDLGTAWVQPYYDDSNWSNGLAQFGYGEGDEQTVIGLNSGETKPPTVYFRCTFQVPEELPGAALVGSLLRDDAAIVYLNGVEIFRNNLPSGNISYSDSALTPIDTRQLESELLEVPLPSQLVRAGTNVLAVEIHQFTGGAPLAFQPKAYWSFDETQGPWYDRVGTNDFVSVGTQIISMPGKIGGSVSNSNSSTDYVLAGDFRDFDFSRPFTIGGWFAYGPSTSLSATCIEKTSEFRLYYTGTGINRYRFEVNGTYVQDQSSGLIGDWRFVVGWYDGTNACIQVNNGPAYSVAINSPALSSTNPLVALKKSGQAGGLAGDEVFLYDRVLSAEERQTLYTSGIRAEDLSFEFDVNGTWAQLPEFVSVPASIGRSVGQSAAFSAVAVSSTSVAYQWNFNGNAILGATNSLLFLPNVTMADAGEYTMTAINQGGSVTSSSAVLDVAPLPVIGDAGIELATNGFSFDITGPSGLVVIVEASTNLINWSPIYTNAIHDGLIRFTDLESSSFERRFYRTRFMSANTPALSVNLVEPITEAGVGIDVSGQQGQAIVIESSTDLQSWSPIQSVTLLTGYYRFLDTRPTVAFRFYRARSP